MADIFDQISAPPKGDIFDRLASAPSGSPNQNADMLRHLQLSAAFRAQNPNAQTVEPTVPESAYNTMVQPFRNVGAMGERVGGWVKAIQGEETEEGLGRENVEATPQAAQAQIQKAANLEQPLPGAIGGTMGQLLQVPGNMAIGAIPGVGPALLAGQQTQQGGEITPGNIASGLLTAATPIAASKLAAPLAKVIPGALATRAVGAGLGAGEQVAINAMSGQPLSQGVGVNVALGGLFGGHLEGGGDIFDRLTQPTGEQGQLFPGGPAENPNTGQIKLMRPTEPTGRSAEPLSPTIPLAGEGRTPDISSLRGIGDVIAQNLRQQAGTENIATLKDKIQDLSDKMENNAAQRQNPPTPQNATSKEQPSPYPLREANAPPSPPPQPEIPAKHIFDYPLRGVGRHTPQEAANESVQAEPFPLAEGHTPQINRPESPVSGIAELPLQPPETEPVKGTTGQTHPLFREGPGEKGTGIIPTNEAEWQESQRQAQNQTAIAKHDRPLDFLRSWWEGRRGAQEATATAKAKIGPAVAQLEDIRNQAPSTGTTEGRQMMGQFEATGRAFGGEADKTLIDLTKEAKDNATKAGTETSAYNPFWLKRLAVPAEGTSRAAYKRGLIGMENYLKERTQPTPEDWYQALEKHGLKPAYDNAFDAQMAGIGEVHRSAEMGNKLNDMLKTGDAIKMKPGDRPPTGWDTVQDLTGSHGQNIAVPRGVATAWRNIIDSSVGDMGQVWNSVKRLRYAGDTMTAKRAIAGYGGELLTSPSKNKIANLVKGYKTAMHPEILNDPEYAGIKAEYEKAAKNGGFENGEWATGPQEKRGFLDTLGHIVTTVPRLSAKYVVEPLRAASMLNLADEINSHPEWPPEKARAYQQAGIDSINRMMGGENGPTGLPPTIDKAIRTIAPYFRWKTAGIRQGGAAVGELAQGKFGPNTKKFIGAVIMHGLSNAVAQTVSTKWNTGKVIAPDLKDMMLGYRTGEKNPDGSDKRAAPVSSLFPLLSAGMQIAKGETNKAIQSFLDPEIERIAEFYTGRNYEGKEMSPTERVTNLLGGLTFTQGVTDDAGKFSPGQVVKNLISPTRELPKTAERSSAQNYFNDVLGQSTPRNETPEQADKWEAWSRLAQTPEDFDKNKAQIYDEMSNDPNVSPNDLKLAFKRWSSPNGIERQTANRDIGPEDLLHGWDLATDEEKAKMRPILQQRLSDISDRAESESRQSMESWTKVYKALQAPYTKS
jgi:hypothetical protein